MADLSQDIARQLRLVRKATNPVGGKAGYVLTKNTDKDYDYSWQQTGESGASGGAGATTFPITKDDLTYTYEISAATGSLTAAISEDAAGGAVASVALGVSDIGLSVIAPSAAHNISLDLFADASSASFLFGTDSHTASLLIGTADPNGSFSAGKGSLFIDKTTPALWLNSTGGSVWTPLGGVGTITEGFYSSSFAATTPSNDGAEHNMEWPLRTDGAALLSLTSRTAPTVTKTGLYTFDVSLAGDVVSVEARLKATPAGLATRAVRSALSSTDLSLSLTTLLQAGDPVLITGQGDGSGGSNTFGVFTATVSCIEV